MVFITRLRRTDQVGEHILLCIDELSDKRFDLKLVGSEHSHLFHGSITDSSLASSKASSYDGSEEQWRAVLRKVLLNQGPADGPLSDIEAVAGINGSTINITVRKNIGGITQRLGSFSLDKDDEREEVDIFDWVNSALATSEQYSAQLTEAHSNSEAQRLRMVALQKQLDDLTTAKREYEEDLLQKFATLLNAKKLKIRDQQRLLAGKSGRTRDPRNDSTHGDTKETKAAASRKGKRKANEGLDPEKKMSVDGESTEDNAEAEPARETPPRSDTETQDDDLDGENDAELSKAEGARSQKPPTSASQRHMTVRGKADSTPSQTNLNSARNQSQADEETDGETDDEL